VQRAAAGATWVWSVKHDLVQVLWANNAATIVAVLATRHATEDNDSKGAAAASEDAIVTGERGVVLGGL
jgi:hypothetical protein